MSWTQKKQGANPASDGAVVAVLSQAHHRYKPIMLFEDKAVVDPRPEAVAERAILEALIQSLYCFHYHNVTSILHCLTDLKMWHYFKLKENGAAHPVIEWYNTIGTINIETHLNFVQAVVADLL